MGKKLWFAVLIMLLSELCVMRWMFGYFFFGKSTENFFEVSSKLERNTCRGKKLLKKHIKGFKRVEKTRGGELSHFDGEKKSSNMLELHGQMMYLICEFYSVYQPWSNFLATSMNVYIFRLNRIETAWANSDRHKR